MVFRPGESGNPNGRPKGTIQRHTQLIRMFRDRGEEVVTKCLEMALNGDPVCMRLAMERILPKLKDDTLGFALPNLVGKTPSDLVTIMFEAMSEQTMSASEIDAILNLIKAFRAEEDSNAVKEVVDQTKQILDELRIKNERAY